MQAVIINANEFKTCGRLLSDYVCGALDSAGINIPHELQKNDDTILISGNLPLITPDMLSKMVKLHETAENQQTTFLCAGKKISSIVNGICFDSWTQPWDFSEIFDKTDGKTIELEECAELLNVNSPAKLAEVSKILRGRKNAELMSAGVFLIDPEQTYVDFSVEVGADTVLYPGTILEGKTKIGSGCSIGPNSRIVDCLVGNSVNASYSVALNSVIGDNSEIGPFAYIRPHSEIGKNCKVGDFVEIKNAKIGDKTKASHLTYIGDADVGSGINFGCGTVTVNYDGDEKHRTIIGDNVFIGCNANLVAPVRVEKGAYVAAGSTITDDVPANSLAIARARQINKIGWHKK